MIKKEGRKLFFIMFLLYFIFYTAIMYFLKDEDDPYWTLQRILLNSGAAYFFTLIVDFTVGREKKFLQVGETVRNLTPFKGWLTIFTQITLLGIALTLAIFILTMLLFIVVGHRHYDLPFDLYSFIAITILISFIASFPLYFLNKSVKSLPPGKDS